MICPDFIPYSSTGFPGHKWGFRISRHSTQQVLLRFKDAGLNKFSEAELRTVLNICDVQGTSMWPKEDLVPWHGELVAWSR